ncbi:hypothetical protein DPMN_034061 [Dreissena polymorpha]|uniref:Uncharacterized protein n=1 Tax=Dreissena polymorpha TaxID=45954 RepID=A0A9D4RLQ9_DREPO|nr:hypothetical protein DPMN_034061 [Dreissena polymorpha]
MSEENKDSHSDELSLISIPSDYNPAGGTASIRKLIEDSRAPFCLVPNDIAASTTPEGYTRYLTQTDDGRVLLYDSSKVTPTKIAVDSNDTNDLLVLAGLTVATSVLHVRVERKFTLVSWRAVLFSEPLYIVVQKIVRYIHQVIEVTGNPVVAVGDVPVEHRSEIQRALTQQCRLHDQLFLEKVHPNTCDAVSTIPSLTQLIMKPLKDLKTLRFGHFSNGNFDNFDCVITSRIVQPDVQPFFSDLNSSSVVKPFPYLPIKASLHVPARITSFTGS